MFSNRYVLHLGILAIVLSSMLVASAAVAQEPEPLTETFTSRYGSLTLQHPAGWSAKEFLDEDLTDGILFYNLEVDTDEDILLQPGLITGILFGPLFVQKLLPDDNFSASTVLSLTMKRLKVAEKNTVVSSPVETVINGRPVIRVDSYDGKKTTVLMTISFGGTDIVLLVAELYGASEPDDSTLLAIMGSLQYTSQAIAMDELELITADNADRLEIVAIHPQRYISAVAFSPDGSMVATGAGNEVLVWDVASGDLVAQLGDDNLLWVGYGELSFTDDGKKLVYLLGPFPSEVRVWDIEDPESGDEPDTLAVDESNNYTPLLETVGMFVGSDNPQAVLEKFPGILGQSLEISGVPVVIVHSPWGIGTEYNGINIDETLLAIRNDNKDIELWDIENNTMLTIFSECSGEVFSLALSPDKSLFAADCSDDDTIRLY